MGKDTMKTKRKAFTLVEQLIVMIIIGILAGSLLLVAAGSVDRASAARIMGEMKTIKSAVQMYESDHGTEWPDHVESLTSYLDRTASSDLAGYTLENEDDSILWIRADIQDQGIKDILAKKADQGAPYFEDKDNCSKYKGSGPIYTIAARKGDLPSCDVSLTPLGNDFFEIVQTMSSRMMDYYEENGYHVSTWKDERYTDIGMGLDFWQGQPVDGLIYAPHGKYVKVEPADDNTIIRVTTVKGETKDLNSRLNWNIWIDVETGTGYYHNAGDPDEAFNLEDVEILKK
jgi:prepilin-type N-terminal cleavage/methylation domain-containing protein